MVGHESVVTTANSVTCPPTIGATNSGFPKSLSIVRFWEDMVKTANNAEGGGGEQIMTIFTSMFFR